MKLLIGTQLNSMAHQNPVLLLIEVSSDSCVASACDVFSSSDEASDAAVESESDEEILDSSVDVDWAVIVVAADDVDPVMAPGSVAV